MNKILQEKICELDLELKNKIIIDDIVKIEFKKLLSK